MADTANELEQFILSMRFILFLGDTAFGFSKVSNISKSTEYETIQEGGVNDYVYALPKPSSEVEKLQLERGYMMETNVSSSDKGPVEDAKKLADVERWKDKSGVLAILGRNKSIYKTLGFQTAYISKWELTDLVADQSAVLIERIELIHFGFTTLETSQHSEAIKTVLSNMQLGGVKKP